VRQTSSASIFAPLLKVITGLPPWRLPIPGPLVETGSEVARVCALEVVVAVVFAVGEGDGEGETIGDGEGAEIVAVGDATATGVIDDSGAAEASCIRWLAP
jgi:hypothetical protein